MGIRFRSSVQAASFDKLVSFSGSPFVLESFLQNFDPPDPCLTPFKIMITSSTTSGLPEGEGHIYSSPTCDKGV